MKKCLFLLILFFVPLSGALKAPEKETPLLTHSHVAYAWAGIGGAFAGYKLFSHYFRFMYKNPDACFRDYLAHLRHSCSKHRRSIVRKTVLFGALAAASHGALSLFPQEKVVKSPPLTTDEESEAPAGPKDPQDPEDPKPKEPVSPAPAPLPKRTKPSQSTVLATELADALGEKFTPLAATKEALEESLRGFAAAQEAVPLKRAEFLGVVNEAITAVNASRKARKIDVHVELMTDYEIDAFFAFKSSGSVYATASETQRGAYEKVQCARQWDALKAQIERLEYEYSSSHTLVRYSESAVTDCRERLAEEERRAEVAQRYKPLFYVAHVKGLMQQPDYVSCGFYAAWFKNKFDALQGSLGDFVQAVGSKGRGEFSTIFPQWQQQIFSRRTVKDPKVSGYDLIGDEPHSLLTHRREPDLSEALAASPFVSTCRLVHLPGHYVSLAVVQVPIGPEPHQRLRVYIPLDSLSEHGSKYVSSANFNKVIVALEKYFFEAEYRRAGVALPAQERPASLSEALERYGSSMDPAHKSLLEAVVRHFDS